LRKSLRFLSVFVLLVGLAFSYSILSAILPPTVAGRAVTRMSCWTLLVLTSYSAYIWLTTRRPVPRSIRWTRQSNWTVIIPALTIVLAGLAVLFPSPKHDRFDMFYIVAIAVIGEEVLFRGLLWDLIDGWSGDVVFLHLSRTIWLTSLAFGVMRVQYHRFQIHPASVAQATYSFGVGMLLGTIRRRTRSIVPAMLAHSAFNALLNLILAAAN